MVPGERSVLEWAKGGVWIKPRVLLKGGGIGGLHVAPAS